MLFSDYVQVKVRSRSHKIHKGKTRFKKVLSLSLSHTHTHMAIDKSEPRKLNLHGKEGQKWIKKQIEEDRRVMRDRKRG